MSSVIRIVLFFYSFIYWSLKGVKLERWSYVSLGAKVSRKSVRLVNTRVGQDVVLGEGTYCNGGSIHSGVIGNYVSIGEGAQIGPFEHGTSRAKNLSPILEELINDKSSPKISSHVWLGCHVTVLRGVTIGKGAIIGAGSVVTKDVGEFEIWGGVPARFLKYRQ